MNETEDGVNLGPVYDGCTAGVTYDASTAPMTMIDETGFPVGSGVNPDPTKHQGQDSDEPTIINRKHDR